MTQLAIETHALVKTFGSQHAMNGIDLQVPAGQVYGVLGPNGAGKTTTLRMLATLLPPDGGSARVLGHDLIHEADRIRGRISLTGQFASVDEDLTATENLVLLARLLGYSRPQARQRCEQLLHAFELEEAASRQLKFFSGGMRRRLDIAASLLVTPDLLFLDEPTTGLDPRSRTQVWDIVRLLVAEGTSVLLTTQYLEEADQLASRIAVIDHGRVIAEGTSSELKQSVGRGVLHVELADPAQQQAACRLLDSNWQLHPVTDGTTRSLTIQLADPNLASLLLADLNRAGIRLGSFAMGQPSLDEVFMALTGQPATTSDEAPQA